MPTAIRTSGAVHVLLHLASQDLKRLVVVVVRREVPAKGEVLFQLRGSEPKNFSQVGNHAPKNIPKLLRKQLEDLAMNCHAEFQ